MTQKRVLEIPNAKLVVFFPTDVSTGTGFLIQGPYRTTPSRDNVPANDAWNRKLINETAVLGEFPEQLVAVRASNSVDESSLRETTALQKLPASEWIASLEAVKHSCSIRTDNASGSRGYLDFLSGFLAQARRKQ